MTRNQALAQIDDMRESMTDADSNNRQLVGIVRDLWDGYPTSDAQATAKVMYLNDYAAGQTIKALVAGIND